VALSGGFSVTKKKRRARKVILLPDSKYGPLYRMLNDAIEAYHEHLATCDIALAFRRGWPADRNGESQVKLAEVKLADELSRETRKWGNDAVILLNEDVFGGFIHGDSKDVLVERQLAFAIDDALESIKPVLDLEGEQVQDEKNRRMWRLKKHDVSFHLAAFERHGAVVEMLGDVVRAVAGRKDEDRPLLKLLEKSRVRVEETNGGGAEEPDKKAAAAS
jgi:hypothetical protein